MSESDSDKVLAELEEERLDEKTAALELNAKISGAVPDPFPRKILRSDEKTAAEKLLDKGC